MSVNINTFKSFVEFVSNKNQIGGTVTVTQFNEIANRAQMAKFEADRNVFIATGEITKYLEFFLKNTVKQVPPTGELPYPSDWQHTAAIRSYFIRRKLNPATGRFDATSVEVQVKESKDKNWGEIQISSLLQPSQRFPKYNEFANEYRFLPKSIGTVYVDYFSTPVAPIWGYTTPNGRPLYNPATSTDFTWDDFAFNEIAMIYLQIIGCNLKDRELSAFSNDFQQTSKAQL
jgi:hypothetical protein